MTTSRLVLSAAAAILLAACSQADGEAKTGGPASDTAPAISAQAATFEARPVVREGVQALPRLVGDTPAIAAINADFDRINADTAGCEGPGEYTRFATQPMTGPGFVTVMLRDEYYCQGTAHPSFNVSAITYDLATGQRMDWVAAAPGLALTRSEYGDQPMPATYVKPFQSTILAEWYGRKMMASADAESLGGCRDTYTTEMLADQFFQLWLDAQTGGLTVVPEFPHVSQACAESATMTQAEMRQFGVTPAIIDAVLAATAAENFGPKS